MIVSSKWRVGETVNSHAFHACIHGFESRTRHHLCGCSLMVEPLPSKQMVWVRFPSSTPKCLSRIMVSTQPCHGWSGGSIPLSDSKNGSVAKWLRQGPATPWTSVRVRVEPPLKYSCIPTGRGNWLRTSAVRVRIPSGVP